MLSNLVNQLKEAGMEDKYQELLDEMPRVRADLGYPPLVTPSSQIVGTMATFNVMTGERYKMVPKEFKELASGRFGRTPEPVKQEVLDKCGIKPEDMITCRPADLLEPGMEKYKAEQQQQDIQQEYRLNSKPTRYLQVSDRICSNKVFQFQSCNFSHL